MEMRMSHMQRVKDALQSTVQKLRSQIEESHKANKVPADYSLGFANAMIFCEHKINMREGQPKFYDRTTSIGALPKPVVLKAGSYPDLQGADEIYEGLRDAVILAARNYLDQLGDLNADKSPLIEAVKKMDDFVMQMEESDNDQEAKAK